MIPKTCTVQPGKRVLIKTGVRIATNPTGLYGLITPRSGLALRHGITVLNSPGLIDNGYRGEIKVLLVNLGTKEFLINPNDRIAQLIILSPCREEVVTGPFELQVADTTERGSQGFGSTGLR